MSDYIKKEDIIIEIERFAGYLDDDMLYRIKLALNRLPSIEVRHGKPTVVKRKQWLDDYKNLDGTLFERSKVLVEYEEDFCPFCGKALGDFSSYCGNCGAKMDGEGQEHE